MSFYLDCCCVSETGSVRTHNEDNFCFFEEFMPMEHQSSPLLSHCIPSSESLCVAVFDGMGGEAAGEVASFAAAQELVARSNYTETWTPQLISAAYQGMSAAVSNARKVVKAQTIGTTVAMLCGANGQYFISNLGDSPVFVFQGGAIREVSQEDTDRELLRALGLKGKTPGLTQFLGMDTDQLVVVPHIAEIDFTLGTNVLLCSDGLTSMVEKDVIADVLARRSPTREKARSLCDLALDAGGRDNVTVIVCECVDSAHEGLDEWRENDD